MKITFEDVKLETESFGDNGTCAIRAIALVTQQPYAEVRQKLIELGHWRPGQTTGMNSRVALKKLFPGRIPDPHYIRQPNGSKYTSITIGKALPKGHYLCHVSGHVFALIDGKAKDYGKNRMRILAVTKIPEELHS